MIKYETYFLEDLSGLVLYSSYIVDSAGYFIDRLKCFGMVCFCVLVDYRLDEEDHINIIEKQAPFSLQ